MCRLLKCCDLERYENHKFDLPEDIDREAFLNLRRYQDGYFKSDGVDGKQPELVGGVIFNPPAKTPAIPPSQMKGCSFSAKN